MFKIGNWNSDLKKVYIIAEIGSNFCGSMDVAKESIHSAFLAGADAVKFQTFKADEFVANDDLSYEYTPLDGISVKVSQHKMFKELELPDSWHIELQRYSEGLGVDFLSSCADRNAADLLKMNGVKALKLASEDLINVELLKHVAGLNLPLIISTGMATENEIDIALDVILQNGDPDVLVMHCISVYPCEKKYSNLYKISALKDKYKFPIGYSDHTIGWDVPYAAVALGAKVIEKHFTLDRSLPGPDHHMSTEPMEFKHMVEKIRELEEILGQYTLDYHPAEEFSRTNFRRSIVASRDLKLGHVLNLGDLSYMRPGDGLRPYQRDSVIGLRLTKDIRAKEMITLSDLEP